MLDTSLNTSAKRSRRVSQVPQGRRNKEQMRGSMDDGLYRFINTLDADLKCKRRILLNYYADKNRDKLAEAIYKEICCDYCHPAGDVLELLAPHQFNATQEFTPPTHALPEYTRSPVALQELVLKALHSVRTLIFTTSELHTEPGLTDHWVLTDKQCKVISVKCKAVKEPEDLRRLKGLYIGEDQHKYLTQIADTIKRTSEEFLRSQPREPLRSLNPAHL